MYLKDNEKTQSQFEGITGFPKMSLEQARKVRATADMRKLYEDAVKRSST